MADHDAVRFPASIVRPEITIGWEHSALFFPAPGQTGDVADPELATVSPDPGEAPGDPGAFSDDYDVAKTTPIIHDITDDRGFAFVFVGYYTSPASFDGIRVLALGSFTEGGDVGTFGYEAGFAGASSVTPIDGGHRLSIVPDAGWPSGVNVKLDIRLVDRAGNVLE